MTLDTSAPPANLRLNGRDVAHNVFEIFAAVGEAQTAEPMAHAGVVEGKPSMAQSLFGRGLLSILRTEERPE
jgi:hypothetical protein